MEDSEAVSGNDMSVDEENDIITISDEEDPDRKELVWKQIAESGRPVSDAVRRSTRPQTELAGQGYYHCGGAHGRCDFRAMLSTTLQDHLSELHQREESYWCVYCASKVKGQDSFLKHLDQHLDLQFSGLKCTVCDVPFVHPTAVLVHMEACHPAYRDYVCWSCSSQFASLREFKSHVDKHLLCVSLCPHCPAKARDKDAVLQHVQSSHGEPACDVDDQEVLLCKGRVRDDRGRLEIAASGSHDLHEPSTVQDRQPAPQEERSDTGTNLSPTDMNTGSENLSRQPQEALEGQRQHATGGSTGRSQGEHQPPAVQKRQSPPREEPSVSGTNLWGTDVQTDPANTGLEPQRVFGSQSRHTTGGSTVMTDQNTDPANLGRNTQHLLGAKRRHTSTEKVMKSAPSPQKVQGEIQNAAAAHSSDLGRSRETIRKSTRETARDRDTDRDRDRETGTDRDTEISDCEAGGLDDYESPAECDAMSGEETSSEPEPSHTGRPLVTSSSDVCSVWWIKQTYTRVDGCEGFQAVSCDFCHYKSKSLSLHGRHLNTVHPEYFKGFACQACNFVSIMSEFENIHTCQQLASQ